MNDFNKKKNDLLELLKIHYGFKSFRPGQEQAIDAILNGQNTVVVMPTGGGKSLIYQLPALVLEGVTIVISPLIALMKDQVDRLETMGIPATCINSSLSPEEANRRIVSLKSGEYKLVYIAPERFYNQEFIKSLQELKVSLFAIDEAHCISQWGHDFRPSYLRLSQAIKFCGDPIVVALTATATPEVRQDIIKQLNLTNPNLIVTGFSRPNLQFAVARASENQKVELIVETIKGLPEQSGIVYAGTRNKADELAEALNAFDLKAVVYHAGMDNDSREWVQENFMKGKAQVVVATNAFGLGIDKKDIRFVIHHDMPGTIEAYYQEAGRAGRDGQNSFCLLFHAPKDRYLREFFIKGDNPPPNIILEIYDFLANSRRFQDQDSVLITYSDIGKELSESLPDMAIGTALKILERQGYISRPNEKTAAAFLKLKSSILEIKEKIGKRVKSQIQILEKLEARFLKELEEGFEINLEEVAAAIGLKKDSLVRTIKKLAEKDLLEYRPPFRGTEIKVLKRVDPHDLELDFSALNEKRNRAYEKLEEMEEYVYHNGCRQEYILKYFRDPSSRSCGKCDFCLSGGKKIKDPRTEWQHKEYL